MKGKFGFLIWVLFLLCVPALGRFVVEKNSLRVTSPDSLKGVYECAIGNFGVPQYGGTMVGTVIYPTGNQKTCKDFGEVNITFKSKPGEFPTIVLADRGDCYFTLKAWNAQNAGAAAVLVADNKIEPLITMDNPEEDNMGAAYLQNITIPSALISKSLGDDIKKALINGDMVNINLDWRESLPHPDERVEYEFWTNSNDECGPKCDSQIDFVKNFKGAAQILEQKGYTQFTPHYITWYCPEAFILSKQCKSQCINHGRYCAPDPEQDFSRGYDGKDVVIQNLRQACLFRVANESNKPWLWWDYLTDFAIRCPMKEQKYTKECADDVIRSLGLDLKQIDKCIGDPTADAENPVLKAEQDAQIGQGSRGDVTILPTLIINNRQYRGKLDKGAVLKAICAGFEETTEPALCLSDGIETNECLENNGGCWQDKTANITACKDTFRGRVCECPVVNGVKFSGDGYAHCEVSGVGRCEINNGGCWQETKENFTHTACMEDQPKGCKCPWGFKGDGINKCEDEWWRNFGIDDLELQTLAIRILSQTCSSSGCERNWSVFERIHTKRRNRLEHDLVYTHYNLRLKERQSSRKSLIDPISLENIDLTDDWVVEAEDDDAPLLDVDEIDDWMDVADAILDEGEGGAAADIDECKEKVACQCPDCKCKNTWGSYECSCSGDFLYMTEHDTCISKKNSAEVSWSFVWVIFLGLAAAGVGGYAIYKYRIRSYMDSEIRAIMAQYMPLDNQGETPNHIHDDI